MIPQKQPKRDTETILKRHDKFCNDFSHKQQKINEKLEKMRGNGNGNGAIFVGNNPQLYDLLQEVIKAIESGIDVERLSDEVREAIGRSGDIV